MAVNVPPPNAELFCIGLQTEITYEYARRVTSGQRPDAAYLAAMRETLARYRLDGEADSLPEPERSLLEQMQPVLKWWEQLALGLGAAGAAT